MNDNPLSQLLKKVPGSLVHLPNFTKKSQQFFKENFDQKKTPEILM